METEKFGNVQHFSKSQGGMHLKKKIKVLFEFLIAGNWSPKQEPAGHLVTNQKRTSSCHTR